MRCTSNGIEELRMKANLNFTARLYGTPKSFVGVYELSSHELHSNFTAKCGFGSSNVKIHMPHHYHDRIVAERPLPMWQINALPSKAHMVQALTKVLGNDSGNHLHDKIWQINSHFIQNLDKKKGKDIVVGYHQEHDLSTGKPVMNEQITVEAAVFDYIMGRHVVKKVRGRRMSGINLYPAMINTAKSTTRKVSTGKVTRSTSKSTRKSSTKIVTTSRRKSSIVLGTTKQKSTTKTISKVTTTKKLPREFEFSEAPRLEWTFVTNPESPAKPLNRRQFLMPITVTICDGSTWNPTCPSGQNIRILSATLGRWSDNSVCIASNGGIGWPGTTSCTASDMMTNIQATCGTCNKNSCSYTVNSANFGWGSPSSYSSSVGSCQNTYKYAVISYVCVAPTACNAATTYATSVKTATCAAPATHAVLQQRWLEMRGIRPTPGPPPGPIISPLKTTSSTTSTSTSKTTTTLTTSTTTLTTSSTSSTTVRVPKYTMSAQSLDPIGGFDFDYNLKFGNSRVSVGFGDVADGCPSGFAKSELRLVNIPILKNFSESGTTWFSCASMDGVSEAVAFNTLTKLDVLNGLSWGNASFALQNASVQASCVPDQATCFVPSFVQTNFPTLWGWIGKLGNNYTWNQLATNLTGIVTSMYSNISDYPAVVDSLVNATIELSSWPNVVNVTDVWWASLFTMGGISNVSLPVASPLCSNNFITNCSNPLVSIAGTLFNTSLQTTNYVSMLTTGSTGLSMGRHLLGISLGSLGYASISWNKTSLCDEGPATINISSIRDLPGFVGTGTLKIICDATGMVQDFQLSSSNFNSMTLTISNYPILFPYPKLVYQHSTDIIGLKSTGAVDQLYGYALNGGDAITSVSTLNRTLQDLAVVNPLVRAVTQARSNFQSFTSTTKFPHLTVTKLDSSSTIQITANNSRTVNSVNIELDFVFTFDLNAPTTYTHNLQTTLTLDKNGSYISLQEDTVACMDGYRGHNTNYFLVTPIGNFTGTGQLTYNCSGQTISDLMFVSTFTDSVQVNVLGGMIAWSGSISFLASTQNLAIVMNTNSSIVQANVLMGYNINPTLIDLVIQASNPRLATQLSPGSWSMFSSVPILNNLTLSSLVVDYASDHLTLNAVASLGNDLMGVYVAMQNSSGNWSTTSAVLTIQVGNTGYLNITTGHPCIVTGQSVNGAFTRGVIRDSIFTGTVNFVCDQGNVTSWSLVASSTSTIYTSTETAGPINLVVTYSSLTGSLVFDGTNSVPLIWTLHGKFNVSDPTTFDISYISSGTRRLSTYPFGNLLSTTASHSNTPSSGTADISNGTFVFSTSNRSTIFSFSGILASQVGTNQVGIGMALNAMLNGYQIQSIQISFGVSFTIPNVGVVVVTGVAGDCNTVTTWQATASVQLSNLPGVNNINGTGSVTMVCSTRVWTATLSIPSMDVKVLGQTLTLTNVVFTANSTMVSLVGQASGSTMGASVVLYWQVSPSIVLQYLQVICSQPTTIYDPTMPFGSTLTSATNGSVSGRQVGLSWTYNFGVIPTLNVTSAVQNGPLQAQLVTNFHKAGNWTMDYTGFDLSTAYGTLSFYGGHPCHDGSMTVKGSLNLPSLTSNSNGVVTFGCNGTNVTSYSVALQDTFTVNAFGYTTSMLGTISYDSFSKWFNVTASPNNGLTQFYMYIDGRNASYYSYGYQLMQPTLVTQLPLSQTFQSLLVSGSPTTSSLGGLTMYFVNLEFTHPNVGNETFKFLSSLYDAGNSATWNSSATLAYTRFDSNSKWYKAMGSLSLSIVVDGVAQVSFTSSPLCPVANTSMVAYFFSLPMGIPPFSAVGSIKFACNGNSINVKNFAIVLTLGPSQTMSLNFLGEKIPISSPTIRYNSTNPVFNMGWNFSPSFGFNLAWSRGAGQQSPYPYTLSGFPLGTVNIASILSGISSVLSSFAGAIGVDPSFGTSIFLHGEGKSLYDGLTSITLSGTSLIFDDVNSNVNFNTVLNLWSLPIHFQSVSPKMSGQWSSIWGVSMFPPSLPSRSPNSGIGWVDNLFNTRNGLNFTDVFFGMSTGSGIYTLPTGMDVETNGVGIVLAGQLLVSSSTMQRLKQQTGMFGHQLSQHTSLEFVIDFTPSYVMCSIDLQVNLTSGHQTFEEIQFQVQVDTKIFEVTLWFSFLYRRTDITPQQVWQGSVGIAANDLGGDYEWKFLWQGQWKNPFHLAPALTLTSIYLDLGLNFETLLPTQFAMAMAGRIEGVERTTSISGQLYLDLATPNENNAVAVSANNLDLDTMLQLYLTNPNFPGLALIPLPTWARKFLAKFSCQVCSFSFNPSLTPISFAPGLPTIAAGIHMNVTQMNFDNFLVIQSATFDMVGDTLSGSLQLSPINYNLFSVTAVGNTLQGPNGRFSMTPTHFQMALNGQVRLFGFFNAMVNLSISADPSRQQVSSSLDAVMSLYGDQVALTMRQLARQGNAWIFYLSFNISTAQGQSGLFGSAIQGWICDVSTKLNQFVANVQAAVTESATNSINQANDALNKANQALTSAQNSADSAVRKAKDAVNSAQDKVNNLGHKCHSYSRRCRRGSVHACCSYASCKVAHFAAEVGLDIAKMGLRSVQGGLNQLVAVAQQGVRDSQIAVDSAIRAGEMLVDGVMGAINSAIQTLMSGLATAIGDFVYIQQLSVSDYFSSAGQTTFTASITVGFFGNGPKTFTFVFDATDLWSTIQVLIEKGGADLLHWLTHQLDGTPAKPYLHDLYHLF